MNEKEIAEIRRRCRPDKSNMTHIYGCYVNESREIIARFHQSLGLMTQEDTEKLLAILRKSLSGTLGRNLVDLNFATQQVVEGEEHRLLMALRNSQLKDENALETFFQRTVEALTLEGSYMILLAHDTYDVPYRSKDGEKQSDASSEVYAYLLCAICPMKLTKPALSYYVGENEFHSLRADWVVAAPELGFLFPAFDERSANIYNALYYTRDSGENHPEFVEGLFRTEVPMAAAAQRETFQSILEEALDDACRYEVVQAVQDQFREMIAEHKERGEGEPLVVSKGAVGQVLKACGVAQSHVEAFEAGYDEGFGADTGLSPRNLVDTRQMEVRTPDVTIHVKPDRGDLLETRVIDGAKYILIRADEGIEVNGVAVKL